MNVSNFANPLETVQMISIVSYLNTLSDFLYSENLLAETDLNKKIPVVNALYDYFIKNNASPDGNMLLVRKLLEGSDLYGEKENETVDEYFVNAMFNHIISSFVFGEYGNIYGFLAEIVRTSENVTIDFLINDIKNILEQLAFENEYGNDSILSPLSVENILVDLIQPLFPLSASNHSIFSVDFIYAQAGSIFLRTGQLKSRYFPQMNVSHMNFSDPNNIFHEYTGLAHIIQHLVETKKVDDSAMNIFSLPALLNYVHERKTDLLTENIRNIIIDSKHWTKAYSHLFSHLHFTIANSIDARDSDYRYRLHYALANFKNYSMLAREQVERVCSNANEEDIEEKVAAYKMIPDAYRCKQEDLWFTLPNLNEMYHVEITDMTDIYFRYEQESIREAFGQSLIDSVNEGNLFIFKGSFFHTAIKLSDDLLEFYYPDEGKSIYYALLRDNYNVTLIKEDDNPVLFREKLGVPIHEKLAQNRLSVPLKDLNLNFEHFLFNITMERTQKFEAHFFSFEFGHKTNDWWKDLGLSLIPFYSCITSSIKGNTFDVFISCPIDTLLLFSTVGEAENVLSKITTAVTRNLISRMGTSVRSISLRDTIRSILNIENKIIPRKLTELLEGAIEGKMYMNLGRAMAQLKNPGIDFIIDKEKVTVIQESIIKVENKAPLKFITLIPMLEMTKKLLTFLPRATGREFKNHPVYVKSIDKGGNTGYGYKFVYLPNNEIAEIRHVDVSANEVLVVFDRETIANNKKLYKEVDEETMKIKDFYFHVGNDDQLVGSFELYFYEIRLSINSQNKCFNSKQKRELTEKIYCARTPDLVDSFNSLESTKDYLMFFEGFTESQIRSLLNSFYFPPGDKAIVNFLSQWVTRDLYSLPDWLYSYKIHEAQLFYDLRFKVLLDSKTITRREAMERIMSLYSDYDFNRIYIPVEHMRSKYIEQSAYYSMKFEDYYALGNQQGLFDSGGYLRLGESTDEARRMRNALNRLAIRQHYDPIEEFPQKLYRGEKRPQNVINKMFVPGKDFSFGRFTSASRKEEIAIAFAMKGRNKDPKVLYEINFSGRYWGARVEKVYPTLQEETVLLPGNKFVIEEVTEETEGTMGYHLKVVLRHKRESPLGEVKDVLREIKKLKNSATWFYYDEKPKNSWSSIQTCRCKTIC